MIVNINDEKNLAEKYYLPDNFSKQFDHLAKIMSIKPSVFNIQGPTFTQNYVTNS